MTGTSPPAARWTGDAYWISEHRAIALGVTVTQEPQHEFEFLLDLAAARRLIIVLTRLLMERDQDPLA